MQASDVMSRAGEKSATEVAARASSNGYAAGPLPGRIVLQPIAAPSILGFFGLATASFVVGAQEVGWYGNSDTPFYLAAFVALFGGLAQFLAGMWAFKARDSVATAIHSTWGAFWGAYGLLYLLVASGTLSLAAVNQNYGFWYIPLAAITGVSAFAALADNQVLSTTLLVYAAGAVFAAIGTLMGDATWLKVAGYVFMLGALFAWYVGSALLLEGSWRRVVLPLGRTQQSGNRPGSIAIDPVEDARGEPGVRMGQ